MPAYKHRTIKLTPKRQSDQTWSCAYRIIDINSTGWMFHKGHSYGSFGSREAAEMAGLEEAKGIINALDPIVHGPRPKASTAFRQYEDRIRKFFARAVN